MHMKRPCGGAQVLHQHHRERRGSPCPPYSSARERPQPPPHKRDRRRKAVGHRDAFGDQRAPTSSPMRLSGANSPAANAPAPSRTRRRYPASPRRTPFAACLAAAQDRHRAPPIHRCDIWRGESAALRSGRVAHRYGRLAGVEPGYSPALMTAPTLLSRPALWPYGPAGIAEAAALIRQGLPVAMPTRRLWPRRGRTTAGGRAHLAQRGRPSFNPLIVHVAGLDAAETGTFDDRAPRARCPSLAGPLTLVLPLREDAGSRGSSPLGCRRSRSGSRRIRRCATCSRVSRATAAPSANATDGSPDPRRALLRPWRPDPLVIDGGPTGQGSNRRSSPYATPRSNCSAPARPR